MYADRVTQTRRVGDFKVDSSCNGCLYQWNLCGRKRTKKLRFKQKEMKNKVNSLRNGCIY